MTTDRPCPVCATRGDHRLFHRFSTEVLRERHHFTREQIAYLSADTGAIDIVICRSCGMVFVHNAYSFREMLPSNKPLDVPSLKKAHRNNTPEAFLADYSRVQQMMRLTLNANEPVNILDFGAGHVAIHARLANLYGPARCVAFDPGVATATVDDIRFVASPTELHRHSPFQGVFCVQVLEHCLEPAQELDNIRTLLHDDGVAFFSVPLLSYWRLRHYKKSIDAGRSWAAKVFHPGHVNYFSLSNFVGLLRAADLEILPVQSHLVLSRPRQSPGRRLVVGSLGWLRNVGFRLSRDLDFLGDLRRPFASGFFVKKRETRPA